MKKLEETVKAVKDWVNARIKTSIEETKTEIDSDTILRQTGDASKVITEFYAYDTRTLPSSGEELQITMGKILRYLKDLRQVAFSGSYLSLGDRAIRYRRSYVHYGMTNSGIDNFLPGEAQNNCVWLIVGSGGSESSSGEDGATDFARAYLIFPKFEASSVTDTKGRSYLSVQIGSIGSTARYTLNTVAATATDIEYIKVTVPKGSWAEVYLYEIDTYFTSVG